MRVYSGRDGSEVLALLAQAPGEHLGWSVSGAGDVDGDGVQDGGAVDVRSGADGALLWRALGDLLGWAVTGPGDLNGDGVADAVATAPYSHTTFEDAGFARALSGPGPVDPLGYASSRGVVAAVSL